MMSFNTKSIRPRSGLTRAALCAAGALLVLSACTAASEFKSPRYADRQSSDAAACNAKAEYLINRDIGGETTFAQSQRDELEVQFATYDARKQRRQYYTDCLSQRGVSTPTKTR